MMTQSSQPSTEPPHDTSGAAYDIIAMGELLVDLIGDEGSGLADTSRFERRQGGSPANLVRTMALAGRRAALVACVGDDGLGEFLIDELEAVGVDTRFVRTTRTAPTSTVLLSRSAETAEFVAYRHADALLDASHVPFDVLTSARVVHTTCFALSRPPARTLVLDAFRRVADGGGRLSLDANYAPAIWSDRAEARGLLREVCGLEPYVKVSEDDLTRLFGNGTNLADGVTQLHEWGAPLVCLTLGSDGCRVSWDGGDRTADVAPAPVDGVVDATGAGDAFWGGFLSATLDGRDPADCARAAGRVAAQKLQATGPLRSLDV